MNPQSMSASTCHTVVADPIDKLQVIEAVDATIAAPQASCWESCISIAANLPVFLRLDREVVRTLAREAATVVENVRLFAASRAKARLDHEIEIPANSAGAAPRRRCRISRMSRWPAPRSLAIRLAEIVLT